MRIAFYRSWILFVLVGLALALASGCDQQPSLKANEQGKIMVKLLLNWKPEPEFGGFFAARQMGKYNDKNLDVTIESSTEHVIQRLAAGQAEFGILAADEVFTARAQGIDLVALFAVYQTNPQGIMAHPQRNFHSLEEVLKSPGTLAVQPGLAYVDFLRRKYDPIAVTIVPYDYSITRFMADPTYSQQCFVTSEPITAQREGTASKVFLIADSGFDPYAAVVVTRGDFLRMHPQVVKGFVDATRQGWRAYLDDPTRANKTMSALNREMSPEAFAEASVAQKPLIENAQTQKDGLGVMTLDRWKLLGAQLVEIGRLKELPVPEQCFVNP